MTCLKQQNPRIQSSNTKCYETNSQKLTEAKMDGLKKGVEAKMNDVEAKMDGVEANMDDV